MFCKKNFNFEKDFEVKGHEYSGIRRILVSSVQVLKYLSVGITNISNSVCL